MVRFVEPLFEKDVRTARPLGLLSIRMPLFDMARVGRGLVNISSLTKAAFQPKEVALNVGGPDLDAGDALVLALVAATADGNAVLWARDA